MYVHFSSCDWEPGKGAGEPGTTHDDTRRFASSRRARTTTRENTRRASCYRTTLSIAGPSSSVVRHLIPESRTAPPKKSRWEWTAIVYLFANHEDTSSGVSRRDTIAREKSACIYIYISDTSIGFLKFKRETEIFRSNETTTAGREGGGLIEVFNSRRQKKESAKKSSTCFFAREEFGAARSTLSENLTNLP